MRPIDADEFRKTLREFAIAKFNIGDKYLVTIIATLEGVDDMLVSAPTVEAIPIEWIKDTLKLAERVQHSKYSYYLKMLLKDWEWEKENETNKR